jgi:2-keto-4-pentenoate hydratase/2-oxohepta-3-ene-1,7-dioic acid hydratase in catechol pathway
MKIVVYGPDRRVGAWVDDHVVDLAAADAAYRAHRPHGGPVIGTDLVGFIEQGAAGLDEAREALAYVTSAGMGPPVVLPAASVTLHAPWPGRRIACVGGNFADHMLGMLRGRGDVPPTLEAIRARERAGDPWGFWKVPAEVLGPDAKLAMPRRARYLDYEGEPAIVLGSRIKNARPDAYRAAVWGITLLHDGSIRDGGGAPRGLSYNLAKNFDGSTAMGPAILVGEGDPEDIEVETRVNGAIRQHFNSRDMIFGWGEILAYLSRDFTFVPGDVISGGTGAGTAADQTPVGPDGNRALDLFLKPGDTVEIASPGIGTLRLHVVEPLDAG